MCGILGYLGPAIDRARFSRALDLLVHRGPDGEGTLEHRLADGVALLGHRRLAIIDLSDAGAQPMESANGRYVIVFNGEIFNFRELRAELEATGVVLRSHSDTEVLLEHFARRGTSIFSRLNGMFALAILDRVTGELTVARDHLGIKPFYYSLRDGGIVFSSEIKAMLALGVPAKLDRMRLGEYLAQMWVQEPHTLFEGIFKLPAGCHATFKSGELRQSRFWDISPELVGRSSMAMAYEQLEALLADAVDRQLISDRPVGSYVSGGVDSSVITHMAGRSAPDLVAVSCRARKADRLADGIPDDGFWADRFASLHPTMRYSTLELAPDLYDSYKELVWNLDEPIADPAVVPAFHLARKARNAGAIVMLSGMGGDELFGGYKRYAGAQWQHRLERLPSFIRRAMLSAANVAQGHAGGPRKRVINHLQRLIQSSLDPWPLSYINLSGHFSPSEIDSLVSPAWREPFTTKLEEVLAGFEQHSRLIQAQRIDLKGFLASHNLIYSDKASMAASVEVRVPLLDYRLAEFAFSLPDGLRVSNGSEKVLLKKLCAATVGQDFAYREKTGFSMAIRPWLDGPLRQHLTDVSAPSGRLAHLFEAGALAKVVRDHLEGRQENSWKIWTLLTLQFWLERFEVAI